MKQRLRVYVRDFTLTPGPRFASDGPDSGEEFRRDVLRPKFERAVTEGKRLIVTLDGTKGYASSFLEEAFGGLVRELNDVNLVSSKITIESKTRPWYESEIAEYIAEALS